MELINFVVSVVLITASGALAPGPLFFVTISEGTRSGAKTGLMFAIAHTLVEFTLVILLTCGLLTVANEPAIRAVVGVAGGIVLIGFGAKQILDSLKSRFDEAKSGQVRTRNLLFTGLLSLD